MTFTKNCIARQDSTIVRVNGDYLLSYWTDTKALATAPVRWKWKQWGAFAGAAGLTVLTYAYDLEIHEAFQARQSVAADNISKYLLEPWGSGLYSLPLMAGIYLFDHTQSRHRQVAMTGVKAYVFSGGAAFILKQLTHRYRPDDSEPPDPRKWDGPFQWSFHHASFPSGHTTIAFAMASVLACGYPEKPWIGVSSYAVAALVGVSRIYNGEHWGSDVVAGAALGSFIGLTLSKLNLINLKVSPQASSTGIGMNLAWRLN